MRLIVRLSAAAVLATSCLFAGSATAAEGVGFAVDAPAVAERGSAWFAADSVDIRGPVLPAIGVVGDWAHRPLVLNSGDGTAHAVVVKNVWTTNLGASVVLAERVRASILVPLQLHANGDGLRVARAERNAPTPGTSFGDLRVAVDARTFGEERSRFRVAVGAAMWAPTGSAGAYATDAYVRIQPRVSLAGDYRRFAYAGSLGVGFRRAGAAGDDHVGAELAFVASAGARFYDGRLLIGPEVFGATGTGGRGAPVEALLGAHYSVASGFRFGAGAGGGLTSASGTPDGRLLVSFEWVPTAVASYTSTRPASEPEGPPYANLQAGRASGTALGDAL